MRKTFLLIASLFFVVGFASAQEVYFAGNHNGTGKIWKNDSLLINLPDSIAVDLRAMQVANDSSIYSAGHVYDTSNFFGRLWLNDSCLFTTDTNNTINRLILNENGWTAAGGNKVWQNGILLYEYPLDSATVSNVYDLALDTVTGDLYSCGTLTDSTAHACVWKNDTVLWQEGSVSTIYAIAFDGSDLYAAGSIYDTIGINGALWRNDSLVLQVENAGFTVVAVTDSSLYLGGRSGDSLCIWQDGEVIYSHTTTGLSSINALVVNELGIYYTGQIDSIGTVWKDGEILYQPEDCDNIMAMAVLPTPPLPEFTLTVTVNDTLLGNVLGGGIYPLGDTATIEAIPNIGCQFLYWNDSITDNPRNVVITQDSTFTAYFDQIEYLIQATAVPDSAGIVSGGGTYHYGDTITLEATANLGYVFSCWNDSIADNPRDVIVVSDSSFVAQFNIQQCTITTEITPEGAGTVEGGGIYDYGSVITLVASNNTGYVFSQWTDGITDNPREILVEGDATYTAIFSPLQFEISTTANPEHGGTVSGGGIYDYGTTAVLTATPNMYFEFLCWSDGAVSNPRSVTVTQNATYTALFHQNGTPEYSITVTSNNPYLGDVTGGGIYLEGDIIEISAIPNAGALFSSWDDGNIDNPRSVIVTQDATYTAVFEQIPLYTIVVESSNPEMGSTFGGGLFYANSVVTIGAIPDSGYYFAGWQDGDMSTPRTFTVTGDATYTAYFASVPPQTYTITVYCNESQGFILGAGSYVEGSTATLAAIPVDGYVFTRWSDGVSDNPREIVVSQDLILAAFFDYTDVEENGNGLVRLYPNPAKDMIHLEGLVEETPVVLYNAMGMLVKTTTLYGDGDISISDLPAGIYVLRVGSGAIRFVKQ